jgi:hypothetical protein
LNWEQQEVVSLLLVEKKDHESPLGVVDSRDCFENISVKWKKNTLVIASSHSAHIKNGLACKETWTTIYNYYKQIRDCTVGTGCNEEFWNMSITNRVNMNLSKAFRKNIYEIINSFMKTRPIFQPSHFRDFMDLNNVVYIPPPPPLFKKHNL